MIQRNLCLGFIALTSTANASAFYDQKENLFINDDNNFHLKPYFTYRPKMFGLVSDKDKNWTTGGYLCQADNFDEFLTFCDNKHPEQDWVRNILLCDHSSFRLLLISIKKQVPNHLLIRSMIKMRKSTKSRHLFFQMMTWKGMQVSTEKLKTMFI